MKACIFVILLLLSFSSLAKDEKPPTVAKCPEMEKHWQLSFDKCVSAYIAKSGPNEAEIAKDGCRCMIDWAIRGRSCEETKKASADDNAKYGLEKCKTTLETLNKKVKSK